jgi:hypothetical protein
MMKIVKKRRRQRVRHKKELPMNYLRATMMLRKMMTMLGRE